MLRLHVVHFLGECVRHAPSFEDRISQTCLPRVGYRLVIDHVLYWELLKELPIALLFLRGLQVSLLELMLLGLE